ncbi:hypothetical protein PAXRUDRAFT_158337 [Paxillus rubicundulus Ve08.2h10]|uniref:Uncharacterized protein n=1 Tax=Paxillus rubicundulus Ve08.2h10 TaxID=930991 RepID=A0A0D0CCT5_9AGAM|nr:hypothetical protein PAXRUDRAFT_158337 [Paxillus rubicundulus Ve08.2h10]
MSSRSANTLSWVVTCGRAAIYLLKCTFCCRNSYQGTGGKITIVTHTFYYA